jgi:hypothetical protein
MGRALSMHERKKGIQRLIGNPEGKRSLGGPRYRWEHNFKMDRKEMGWESVDRLLQDWYQWWVLVNMVMNLQVPRYGGNFLTS